jgi:hypothetical protein
MNILITAGIVCAVVGVVKGLGWLGGGLALLVLGTMIELW